MLGRKRTIQRYQRPVAILTTAVFVAALCVSATATVSAAPPSTRDRVITPPYDEAIIVRDGVCEAASASPAPTCEEFAQDARGGLLWSRARITAPAAPLASNSASGAADATSGAKHYVDNWKTKGARLTITFRVRMNDLIWQYTNATPGDSASLTAVAFAWFPCTGCTASSQIDQATLRNDFTVTISVQAPLDEPLGRGYVQLVLRARASLASRFHVFDEPHEAIAEQAMHLYGIELTRS